MANANRGLKLRCRDGHFEMASFELKGQPEGFWMWVSCDFGGPASGHWLAPDPAQTGRVMVTSQAYCWPSAVGAYEARDRWEAQEEA